MSTRKVYSAWDKPRVPGPHNPNWYHDELNGDYVCVTCGLRSDVKATSEHATTNSKAILRALGRQEWGISLEKPLNALKAARERVLVTGAAGEIGRPLVKTLHQANIDVIPTDVDIEGTNCEFLDVTRADNVLYCLKKVNPTVIINLAAAKLAPMGEVDPWSAAKINLLGVMNLLEADIRLVQASTCKAIHPQTAYGATKLVAERMVLNRGGVVVRYVNVPECGPSMVTIWEKLPSKESIPVTPCTRYVITATEAVALTVWGCTFDTGRYKISAGEPVSMAEYASRYYPGRSQVEIQPRRGDRLHEPHHGEHEWVIPTDVPGIEEVKGWHDA